MKKILFILSFFLFCCSPYRNNPINKSFHNLTAHYNAYYIANERIQEIEAAIFESQDWNYNKILPLYPQFDSTKSASLLTEIEDCIVKASIAIQRHPGSKWEDDSYILVGKARYYGLEFPDAIETFKYVNTHSKDENAQHEALSNLIRVFTEAGEYRNAEAVCEYLRKEDLNKKNQQIFFLNSAYLYQKQEDESKMVENLVKAEPLINAREKARVNFIIAQTFQDLKLESEAFSYYKNVLRSSPNYELEFYSKLYMAQVTELAETNDLKKIRKYFRDLLRDPKNLDYQDKIYFELAGFEFKNNNLDEAIENLKLSTKNSKGNQRQKSYAYHKLGQIYYDSIKNYRLAKNYYDSTITTMPQDEEEYAAIKKRKEILDDFVEQVLVIQKNDSLLHLSTLPQDSLLEMATVKISSRRAEEKEKKEKEKEKAINRARNITDNTSSDLITTAGASNDWYFDNVSLVSKGINSFERKWGDRPLEDNWRRSSKPAVGAASNANSLSTSTKSEISEATGEVVELTIEDEALQLIAAIPQTEEEKGTLLAEIKTALFLLGGIYNLRLEEDQNAIETFQSLLDRFPNSEYEVEVLYQLYLLTKKTTSSQSSFYGETIKEKYPESIFAKLVDNPNYREESFAVTSLLQREYKNLYQQYKQNNVATIGTTVDSLLSLYPENEYSDNVALLKVLATGKMEEQFKYTYELTNFMKEYPESELQDFAKALQKTSEEFQVNKYNSGKAKYIKDFDQIHTFAIVYDIKSSMTEELPNLIDNYLEEYDFKNLRSGNLIISEEKSVLIVNQLDNKAKASLFLAKFNENTDLKQQFKGQRFSVFVITKDNFDILYTTKDVESYLSFFAKHYK